MGVGEVVGIMFIVVSVLLLGLEWLSKESAAQAVEPDPPRRGFVRYRTRR